MARLDLLTANDAPGAYPASWYAETAIGAAPRPALRGAERADVCVIGGGYAGLSAALHLRERGYDVVLIEAQRLGWGASGRNGGQIGSGQRRDQDWLERTAGRDQARMFWNLAEEAKATVRGLIERHAIPCDYRAGVAHAALRPGDVAEARAAAEKLARDYGYADCAPLDRAGIAELLGTDAYQGGDLDMGAGHLHPLNYALGLAGAAEAAGARVYERSRAVSVEAGRVRTAEGEVSAGHILLCCNGYLGDLVPRVAERVMPINNFIIATEPLGPERAAALIPTGVAAADSRFVVNYWRLSADGRMLFGGGESYGYRFPRDIAGLVRPRMLGVYPGLADLRVTHAWGGTLGITASRMPAFQRLPGGIFSAAGFSGHGVAMATLAGKLLAEAVAGTAERFDLFAGLPPPAFPGGAALRWPLLVLAMSWYSLRDRL
ncbi:NAD(P)/FAD-dependent oxidoreductase [Amaricoccus solimangrovi]|uniref:FAD-binding oxidoreductase n=1 Tax=Amaricoccus solimangrovi TaxID=2589815 RepID=A0A501WW61_9RHOB|nr:FAD-binding oxidoreductase [Amaricoccus solimangrovi]TPE53678.1 FAD-binding oxidoreductase [Amaricoccus solimangrovi]